MQAVDAQIDGRALADLDDLLLDLLLHLGDHLLDAGGMDSAVGDELMQRQTGDLAAHGVEAAQDDRFGRVVDDDLDAGSRFQRTDVAPLAAMMRPLTSSLSILKTVTAFSMAVSVATR